MRRLIQKLSLFLCMLLVLMLCGTGHAQEQEKSRQEDAILNRLFGMFGTSDAQSWLDGAADRYQELPIAWYYTAVLQGGTSYDCGAFGNWYAAYVKKAGGNMAAASWLNAQLCLYSAGHELPDAETVLSHISERSIMSLIYGLHLSNTTANEYVKVETVLGLQCEDGGFAIGGESGDVDVTAMMLTALAPHYGVNPVVTEAAERAIDFLSAAQLSGGGFVNNGVNNSESVSVVIIALSSLGIDCENDARFCKEGSLKEALMRFYREEGGFSHTTDGSLNELATAEGLCALVAMRRRAEGKSGLYLFDRAKPQEPSDGPTPAAGEREEKPSETSPEQAVRTASKGPFSYKLYASVGIVFLGALWLIVQWRRGRLRRSGVLLALVLTVAALLTVLLTNFESVGKHYADDIGPVDSIGEVTLSVRCDTVVGKKGAPAEEYLIPVGSYRIGSETTAFDVLSDACRQNGIALDYTSTGSIYIKGIGSLYEFDFGELSGWMYSVNGAFPSVGAGELPVRPGDEISFRYTCSLGNDIR